MTIDFQVLANKSIAGETLTEDEVRSVLHAPQSSLLSVLDAAYKVRHHFWQNKVTIHIINNAKNGNCPEDCAYCVQAKSSKGEIADYPIKSDEEILAEAKNAYEKGAHRYCMVFAGRGPSKLRVRKLSSLIQQIKSNYPIEVCLSPGLLDEDDTQQLKEAGLDRLNHNLNTSESYYPEICQSHTYQDRMNTLLAAKKAGLEMCSGIIVGMGETEADRLHVAYKLREMNVASIPINFYMPVEGNALGKKTMLSPQECLKILCVFRLLNPQAEIRMAAGREIHFRQLQTLGLFAASSLFMDGYLNTKGTNHRQTLEMIQDAGFEIVSDQGLEELLAQLDAAEESSGDTGVSSSEIVMKSFEDLRPTAV